MRAYNSIPGMLRNTGISTSGDGPLERKHPDEATGFCVLTPTSKLYLTEVKRLLKSIWIKIFLKTVGDLDIWVVPCIGF